MIITVTPHIVDKFLNYHRNVHMITNYPVVNFEDRKNNNADNLSWVTPKENNDWSLSKMVYKYDLDGNYICSYESTREASHDGFNRSHVANVCRGIERQHKGYLFSYKKLSKEQAIQRLSKTHYIRYGKCNGS